MHHHSRACTACQSIYFWPLFTGTAIPIDDWRSRMWLDTWLWLLPDMTLVTQADVSETKMLRRASAG